MKTLKEHLKESKYQFLTGKWQYYEEESIIKAVKEWLKERLDWATEKEIYDLANTYKELIEEAEK